MEFNMNLLMIYLMKQLRFCFMILELNIENSKMKNIIIIMMMKMMKIYFMEELMKQHIEFFILMKIELERDLFLCKILIIEKLLYILTDLNINIHLIKSINNYFFGLGEISYTIIY